MASRCKVTPNANDVNHNSVFEPIETNKPSSVLQSMNSFMRDSVSYVTSSCASMASSLASYGDDSVFHSTSYEDDVTLTIGICRDYICYRVKRDGFGSRVTVKLYAPAVDQTMSSNILNLGSSFERMFPKSFRQVSRQIGCLFNSEDAIRRLYFRLAVHILGVLEENYTWGRILALLALAGAMAVDCISQGHPGLVEPMIAISSDFIRKNSLDWIIKKGGWHALVDHFSPESAQPCWSGLCLLKSHTALPVALFIFSLLLLALVIHLFSVD
uniref:Bcl-2 Bcl-2 homology region 1-3 domain-containing protein n=1 Tax=Ciona savignyi TaxID=51511 RepID=H2Z3W0_CIOSA